MPENFKVNNKDFQVFRMKKKKKKKALVFGKKLKKVVLSIYLPKFTPSVSAK